MDILAEFTLALIHTHDNFDMQFLSNVIYAHVNQKIDFDTICDTNYSKCLLSLLPPMWNLCQCLFIVSQLNLSYIQKHQISKF